jgi:hypothetical protein
MISFAVTDHEHGGWRFAELREGVPDTTWPHITMSASAMAAQFADLHVCLTEFAGCCGRRGARVCVRLPGEARYVLYAVWRPFTRDMAVCDRFR